MKVKELIFQLQSLEQEKDIDLVYDGCYIKPIDIDVADEDDALASNVKVGQYIIKAD